MTRKILHLDLDAFFCAVEEQRDPALRNRPFAVGGRPESRGVVASCSYAARRFGVHSARPMSRTVRLCPQLEIVPPRFKVYSAASRQVTVRVMLNIFSGPTNPVWTIGEREIEEIRCLLDTSRPVTPPEEVEALASGYRGS